MTLATTKYYGTGRRKSSVARVYLVPGTGKITINKRDIDEYLGLETLKVVVRQPLVATETVDKFDVLVNVRGGGYSGQAGAIRHGIARALLQVDAEYRPTLKAAGFLTRDPRMKERKKVLKEIISLIGVYIKDFIPEAWLPGFFCIFISDYSFPMGCKDVLILRHSWNSYYEHLTYN